jgi:hypothetical protein
VLGVIARTTIAAGGVAALCLMSGCDGGRTCTTVGVGELSRIALEPGLITDDSVRVTVCVGQRCLEDLAHPGTRFVEAPAPDLTSREVPSVSVMVHGAAPVTVRAPVPLATRTITDVAGPGCHRRTITIQATLHRDGTLTVGS